MPRSSRTGYYQMIDAPSDSEGQEIMITSHNDDATSQEVTNIFRNTRSEPDSRVRRTLRSVRERWKQRKYREEIRGTLPTFRPWFTVIVALVNVGMFVAVSITDGFTAIKFTPKKEHGIVDGFDGQQPEVREEPANFFIGPTATDLVHHGAKYATVGVALCKSYIINFAHLVYAEGFSFRI